MKYKKQLFALLLLPVLHACTDLDETLYQTPTDTTIFKTEEGFRAVTLELYSNLRSLGSHGGYFSLQEIGSDEICLPQRGGTWGETPWVDAHRHDMKRDNTGANNAFLFLYSSINACNRVMHQFEELQKNGDADPAMVQKYSAEVRALRALYYYWALDGFGNIPIITEYASEETQQPYTVDRPDVFKFVENELRACYQLLDKKNDATTYGRMNYYAAIALWAKLYLNAEVYSGTPRWYDVISTCDAIIQSGLFSLEPDYRDNFKVNNQGSREFILAIPFDEHFAQGFNLAQMTLHYGSQATYQLQEQPWNGYCTLQEFYEMHQDADVRKQNFLVGPQFAADGITPILDISAEPSDPDGPQVNFTPGINSLGPDCLRQAGARIGKYEFKTGATPNLDNDMPIFRYADILLMKAEALWRLDPNNSEALELVNQVRNRAYEPDQPLQQLTAQNLLDERGRELFYEGMRRQDLIRFGVYGNPTQFMPGSDPCREIWPIPAAQLTLGPNIRQNPCY